MASSHDADTAGITRRKSLAALGGMGALALAGCTSNDGGDGDDGNDGDDGGLGGDDGGDGGDGLSGEVIVTGSSTVYPVSIEMQERFMDENEDVSVTVDSTGSGGGFANNFCPGDSDINGASRPIKEEEIESCDGNDVEPVEFRIAGDALTVAVSPDNDWVDSMTFDELAQIWNGDDPAETWADVNEDWPDEEFDLYGPDDTSGTFDWFTENVVGEAGNHRSDYEPTEDDNTIVQGISNNEHSIGYFGFAYYQENEDDLKALNIAETSDDEPSAPSLEAASAGDYPMARPLFIYPSADSLSEKDQVYSFVEYYLENSNADWIADDVGYVPSNEEQVEENLSTLEEYA
ncbi:PstS family phosphate ABC transporter substrate-binding protein [Halorubrum lipolyticum]|uniref:Phosphate ABC transporter periplasmic substrate-binding protein n=1 Tax=Halorubrum lipolyticum DSM 21995 TaxID=1227482 RepID=M0NW34_9EURY|nr:PstS family phosphate ABC transporter substrate-binding protein [Halorubrum lipolyticum]EMA61778.1 phosphate ABC transporter periplasmic substrate-binding protein [Halorubrum lipolyticum DSM 21995]